MRVLAGALVILAGAIVFAGSEIGNAIMLAAAMPRNTFVESGAVMAGFGLGVLLVIIGGAAMVRAWCEPDGAPRQPAQ
jgi:hypothetical protein